MSEAITLKYERKLAKRMLQTDFKTRRLFEKFSDSVAPVLEQFRRTTNGVVIRDLGIQKQLDGQLADFSEKLRDIIISSQGDAWNLSNDKTDEIISELVGKMSISKIAKKGLFERNEDAFKSFQKRKYSGMNLSKRVWDLTDQNKKLLNIYLDNGLSAGQDARTIAADVKKLLKDPDKLFRRVRDKETGKLKLSSKAKDYHPGRGVYRSSYQNARRLAATEVNMAYRAADQDRWNRLDFVLGYEVKLSNRHPAPDICDHAKGRYPKDFKFVGWHPRCLCYATPVLPGKDELLDNIVDDVPITGYVSDIPEDMKKYISNNMERIQGHKTQPFWVQDNFSGGRIENGINLTKVRIAGQ